MTDAIMQNTDDDLREMLGGLLRARTESAKDLAQRVGCDVRPAEHYRAGRHFPPLPVFLKMCRTLGDDLYEAVRNPHAAAERLEQEVADLERQLAEKRVAQRTVASGIAQHKGVQAPLPQQRAAGELGRGGGR